MKENFNVAQWYENAYRQDGFSAQRAHPNEELCRSFGRNYFALERSVHQKIKVLEVGCGTCPNLWMVAHEAKRILKPAGKFFSFFPSKRGDAFINRGSANLIDEDTLEGIKRYVR